MDEAHVHDITRVIQLALAPAFLLTAIGSLLNVFANRLARIVDRSRSLEHGVASAGGDPTPEATVLRRRGHLVRWAISLGTGAALLVTLVIALSFLGFLMGRNFAGAVAACFVGSMVALIVALSAFLGEVTLAIGTFNRLLGVPWPGRRSGSRGGAPGPGEGG